jgi:Mechanosensitive ion channel, conserved TM helix
MEKVDMLLEPIRVVLAQIGAFLPRLALAVAVLLVGWVVARMARFAVVKGLRAINFNILTERAGTDGFLQQGGIRSDTTDIFGALVYWLVLLATLVIAFNGLGLTNITDLLGQLLVFLPKLIVALLILVFGAYFARFIGNAVFMYCRNAGVQDAALLGKLAQYAIVTFIVLIALDHANVGGTIIRQSFLIILAGIMLALALAFGLGGQRWAADLLERWWPKQRKD